MGVPTCSTLAWLHSIRWGKGEGLELWLEGLGWRGADVEGLGWRVLAGGAAWKGLGWLVRGLLSGVS